MVEVLTRCCCVFIVVELLSAVRRTLAERDLVAEPFLLVGIIASIKEIVVLSVRAADAIGTGRAVPRPAVARSGCSGSSSLLLGLTALAAVRRKEREPDEGSSGAMDDDARARRRSHVQRGS